MALITKVLRFHSLRFSRSGKEGVLYYPLPCRVVEFFGSGTGSNLKSRVASTLGYSSGPALEALCGAQLSGAQLSGAQFA